MQHHIEYDSDAMVLVGTMSGKATVEGFHHYIDAVAQHANLPECTGIISDFRELGLGGFTSDVVRGIVERTCAHADRWRDVVHPFVVGNETQFGMTRMYEIMGGSKLGFRTHVCYTLEEAKKVIALNQA